MAALVVVSLAFSVQAAVYKWVDAQGDVHYSDVRPNKDAEELKLPEPTTYKPVNSRSTSSSGSLPEKSGSIYRALNITKPKNDATIRSNRGEVQVQLEVLPTLVPSHKIRIYLDGEEVTAGLKSTSVMLKNVDRGSHQLQAQIYDVNNQLRISSGPVTFHLKRHYRKPDSASDSLSSDYTSGSDDKYEEQATDVDDVYPGAVQESNPYPDESGGVGKYPGIPKDQGSFTPNFNPQ